jgi:hypothetical protein
MSRRRGPDPGSYQVVPATPPPPKERPYPFEEATEEDRRVIEERQLRHRAPYLLGIARRCRYGYPQVFVCTPLRLVQGRLAAESTLCWLSCPLLSRAIDRLEKEGWLDRLAHLVRSDESLRQEVEEVHRQAAEIRWGLVPTNWRAKLESDHGLARERWILRGTGVAGVTRPDHVKCLHAHLADYLWRGTNPLGRLACDELARRGIRVGGDELCWQQCKLHRFEPTLDRSRGSSEELSAPGGTTR